MKKIIQKNKKTDDSLSIYLNEIKDIPLLSREEEDEIARAAAAGDKAAREKLVKANLRFVINIARKYRGLGMSLDDLISEGNVGLIIAVDHFDIKKGYHFISYAVWWIRQSILKALKEKNKMIRLPSNRAAELSKIIKAKEFVRMKSSPENEINEIAKLLNMDKDHVTDLINISKEILSLNKTVSSENNAVFQDYIADNRYDFNKHTDNVFLEADIEAVLETLEKEEASIIRCRYGLGCNPMTLQEIGTHYHLTKERIRQIEEKALMHLRSLQCTEMLESYVA